jgi:protein gp37
MADTSAIGWTTSTWNPWLGCTKVSPGCDNCYMFDEQRRYGNDPEQVRRSKTKFRDPLKWKEPREIFTCSWGDWFHAEADEWRDEAWEIVRQTQHHTYQILTKRHGRIAHHLPNWWPMPNVWLGVSAESDGWFWRRARALADVPGDFVRFISMEPLIGPIDVHDFDLRDLKIDWVIVGGESKAGARPMDLDWVRTIRDACIGAGVAFYLKQLGGHPNKRADAAAVLDGRTWTEMPKRKDNK